MDSGEDGALDGILDDRDGSPVVEELTFRVESGELGTWLARESTSWDDYLARQPGFLRKEVWLGVEAGPEDGPGRGDAESNTARPATDGPATVRVLVWWASRKQWQDVPHEELAAVDATMGPLLRSAQCRWYNVARQV